MEKKYIISPSILSADFTRLGEQIRMVEQAGADWIHVDVMDGHFVPNLTMGPFIVAACRRATQLPLDIHLMIENPDNLLDAFANAGATNLTVHYETCPNLHRTIQKIHALSCNPGVVINPGTSADVIQPVLHMVHHVLVLTVNPGYSGQEFLPETLPKIRQLRKMLDETNPDAMIEVDGGISPETLPLVLEAGAQAIVAATAIFKNPAGITAGVRALRACFPN